jgi:GH15 family glucan-1,4-alpha-glucosidase
MPNIMLKLLPVITRAMYLIDLISRSGWYVESSVCVVTLMSTSKCFLLSVSTIDMKDHVFKTAYSGSDYAQDKHTTEITNLTNCKEGQCDQRVTFISENLSLELNATIDCGEDDDMPSPKVVFEKAATTSSLGDAVTATFRLHEGQAVSFILRNADDHSPELVDTALVDELQASTHKYWARWMASSKYIGRWEQVVTRSLLLLKMLTFEPSGAIVAAPTFSLPEDIGGSRNWDYRYSWVRDASFTIYILLRMGYSHEAEAYISYIFSRIKEAKARRGALPIMFT